MNNEVEALGSSNKRVVKNKKEILESVENVSSVSEETASSTEEVAAFADEFQSSIGDIKKISINMRESSKSLSDMINQFKF